MLALVDKIILKLALVTAREAEEAEEAPDIVWFLTTAHRKDAETSEVKVHLHQGGVAGSGIHIGTDIVIVTGTDEGPPTTEETGTTETVTETETELETAIITDSVTSTPPR